MGQKHGEEGKGKGGEGGEEEEEKQTEQDGRKPSLLSPSLAFSDVLRCPQDHKVRKVIRRFTLGIT